MEGKSKKGTGGAANSKDGNIDQTTKALSELTVADIRIPTETNEFQSLYTWKEFSVLEEAEIDSFMTKHTDQMISIDLAKFSELYFLSYIYDSKKNGEKSMQTLKCCEDFVKDRANVPFYEDIVEGLQHLVINSRYNFYLKNGKLEEANDIFSSCKSFKNLSIKSQAAIWAVKAYILKELGYEGKIKALEYATMAKDLDPDEDGKRRGAWYHLAGKLKGQIRRAASVDELPSKEELQLLERAILKNPLPLHLVTLADSYRDAAKVHLKNSHQPGGISEKMSLAAQEMYKKAIEDKDINCEVLKRAGAGLMKLRKEHRDVKFGEQALLRALEMEPHNPGVLLSMGNFYEWQKRDYRSALDCYEKALKSGCNLAATLIIKMRHNINEAYNPVNDCNEFISSTPGDPDSLFARNQIAAFHIIKGEYFLFMKNDLMAAAKEWEKAIKLSPHSKTLLQHPCIFKKYPFYFNIYEILRMEVPKALKNKKFSRDEQSFLRSLLQTVNQSEINTSNGNSQQEVQYRASSSHHQKMKGDTIRERKFFSKKVENQSIDGDKPNNGIYKIEAPTYGTSHSSRSSETHPVYNKLDNSRKEGALPRKNLYDNGNDNDGRHSRKIPEVTNSAEKEDEFDIFGRSVALQLRNLPLPLALETQMKMQSIISEARLKNIQ